MRPGLKMIAGLVAGLVLTVIVSAAVALPKRWYTVHPGNTLVEGDFYVKGSWTATSWLFPNGETITNTPDGTLLFSSNTATGPVLQCGDTASPSDCTLTTTGAGAMKYGGASVTSHTFYSDSSGDGEMVLPLQCIGAGEVVVDTLDFAQLEDALDMDVSTSITGTAGKVLSVVRALTDATSENGVTITVTPLDTTAGTTNQNAVYVDCADSTQGCDNVIVIDNSDTAQAAAAGLRFVDGGGGFTNYVNATNWQVSGAGELTCATAVHATSVTTPLVQTAANAATWAENIPVTGADAGAHTASLQIDGDAGVSVAATGDGAGHVGAKTIQIGVGADADVITIGDANAIYSWTDAHHSMTDAGALACVSVASPLLQTADNATTWTGNIPVSGADAGPHTQALQLDSDAWLSAVATGDGAGHVGVKTVSLLTEAAANVGHVGNALAELDLTSTHWSVTEPGVCTMTDVIAPTVHAADNAASLGLGITVTGADAGAHCVTTYLDATTGGVGVCATGDGAGSVGPTTTTIGSSAAADVVAIGDANAVVSWTDAHHSMSDAGALVCASATLPTVQTADNTTTQTYNLPVSGADAGAHESQFQLDGTDYLSCTATGNGAGGVGVMTCSLLTGAAANVMHAGNALSEWDLASTHWSVTEPGVATMTSVVAPDLRAADNAAALAIGIGVTGADAGAHAITAYLDGTTGGVGIAATGDGAGSVGPTTNTIGVSAKADIITIGDANAVFSWTDAHHGMTDAGALTCTSVAAGAGDVSGTTATFPTWQTADNASNQVANIPVSGVDAAGHQQSFRLDNDTWFSAEATGDGAGHVGIKTVNLLTEAAANVGHVGNALAELDLTSTHWSITEPGVVTGTALAVGAGDMSGTTATVPTWQTAANAATQTSNLPVTGADAGPHEVQFQIDGGDFLSCTATGNGAGGVGVTTCTFLTGLMANVGHIGSAMSEWDVTSTHWSITEPGVISGTSVVTPSVSTADNAATLVVNMAVTGADAGGHMTSLQIDGDTWLSASATGDGAGHVGTQTVVLGSVNTATLQLVEGAVALDIAAGSSGNVVSTGDTGTVTQTMLADTEDGINFPLRSFWDCQTDGGADFGFGEGADDLPDFISSATDGLGMVLRWDDAGGQEDQNAEACNQFVVPDDYASGGALKLRALKDGETGANAESFSCAVSVNGGILQATGSVTIDQAATKIYTCTPTIAALAAGDSVSFYVSVTSAGTMDDTVDLAAARFFYTKK